MSDAPGWSGSSASVSRQESGPTCWKCRGACKVSKKDRKTKKLYEAMCAVCDGVGVIKRKRKEVENLNAPGSVSKRQRPIPDDWVIPGPQAKGDVEPENGEELCHLLGHWRIFQRIGGHRWSTDDLVTAYIAGVAWREANGSKPPTHCLDLGTGIGTVLLMTAWQFPEATCRGIEAQKLSAGMARRSIRYNGCEDRCSVENGDIRTFEWQDCDNKFDLITGTPPYFPVKFSKQDGSATALHGSLPSCEQSAPARCEFRGGIEAYVAAAQPRLRNSDSRFVVVEGLLESNHQRVVDSAEAHKLDILRQVNVHGRDDKPPLFAIYEMRLRVGNSAKPECKVEALNVRMKGGKRSDEYLHLMKTMGIPP